MFAKEMGYALRNNILHYPLGSLFFYRPGLFLSI